MSEHNESQTSKKPFKKTKNTLPATIPQIITIQGIEYITFVYSVKGTSREYRIKTDIESLDIESIPIEFKTQNCVYPRAFVDRAHYTGNRWDYETSVNVLGWKLAWLNQDSLVSKRGLIQRAVDSYRNRFPESRSRRVVRQEKLTKGILRKRSERSPDPQEVFEIEPVVKKVKPLGSIIVETVHQSTIVRIKCRCDFDSVNVDELTFDFKSRNSVFPSAIGSINEYNGTKYEEEVKLNEMAWKLAYLNPKIAYKRALLQRALDTYRNKYSDPSRPGKRAVEQVSLLPVEEIHNSSVIPLFSESKHEDDENQFSNVELFF